MGQFKPMVKMMTTEPSVELKLKRGGHVNMKKGGHAKEEKETGHKMMDGGALGALARTPALVGRPAVNAPVRVPGRPPMAMRRKAMAARPAVPGMMKEGGESKAMHKAEISKMKGLEKELKSHESKPASKGHKGLKTGGVAMGNAGGFKEGGSIPKSGIINTEGQGGEYRNTKMHTAAGEDHTPKKTGEVKMGNAGGYKAGGKTKKYAKGGGVEGNVSSSKPGVTNTTTGEVKLGNAGGYKKGGMPKKAYATGGTVSTGRPVAMPQGRKPPSKAVSNDRQSGTFKRGGLAKGGELEDLSKGAYDKSLGPSPEDMDIARTIRSIPRRMYEGVKGLIQPSSAGSVTKTKESVTVSPGKKRGGVMC